MVGIERMLLWIWLLDWLGCDVRRNLSGLFLFLFLLFLDFD